jgi:hypothetical protein
MAGSHLWWCVYAATGDGSVNHIPYTEHKPEFQKAHAWPTIDYYGQICVYIDCEKRQPPYQPPRIPDIDDGSMVFRGRHRSACV